MTDAITRIRAALDAGPTPGKWKSRKRKGACYYDGVSKDGYVVEGPAYVPDYENPMLCWQDSRYIAACNPAAMTEVLALVDQQAAEIAALKCGEYICQKCGLRKDAYRAPHEF